MGRRSRSRSSAFACGLLIPWLLVLLWTISPTSGARPLPPQSKALSVKINHSDYHHNQQISGSLNQKSQLDLGPSDVTVKSAFKSVFTMLHKGPVTPSGPSPYINNSPKTDSTEISPENVSDQPWATVRAFVHTNPKLGINQYWIFRGNCLARFIFLLIHSLWEHIDMFCSREVVFRVSLQFSSIFVYNLQRQIL